MTYKALLYLSLFVISSYAAEVPERNRYWADSIEDEITRMTTDIKILNNSSEAIKRELLAKNIYITQAQDGYVTIQPTNTLSGPVFRIIEEEDVDSIIDQYLQQNPSLTISARAIRSLVTTYLMNHQTMLLERTELKKLREKYEKYKKPVLRHPAT